MVGGQGNELVNLIVEHEIMDNILVNLNVKHEVINNWIIFVNQE